MKMFKNWTFCPPPIHILGRRYSGSGILILSIVTAMVVALTSLSVVRLNQASYSGINNSKIMVQAQQYAESKAAIVKATKYTDLAAHGKQQIQNSNGYYTELSLSAESNYSSDIKQRTASIKIYKNDESLPRFTLDVLKTSVETQSSGVPIGTIIAWASTTVPTEGGTWLLCNGQSCSAYPKLSALVGSTVPNLNGRFLEGTTGTNVRSTKAAGLPNITGTGPKFHAELWTPSNTADHNDGAILKGASYGETAKTGTNDDNRAANYGWNFDASKANSIYGASSTVQPPSYLVRFYIKAA